MGWVTPTFAHQRQPDQLGCWPRGVQQELTHLHGTGAFVRAPLSRRLKAISHSLAGRPVNGGQRLHELLQADHPVVPEQRLQLEVLGVRDMQLRAAASTSLPARRDRPRGPPPGPHPPPAAPSPPRAHVGVGRAVVPVLDPRRHGQGPVDGAGEGQGAQEVLGLVPEPACGGARTGSAGPPPGLSRGFPGGSAGAPQQEGLTHAGAVEQVPGRVPDGPRAASRRHHREQQNHRQRRHGGPAEVSERRPHPGMPRGPPERPL